MRVVAAPLWLVALRIFGAALGIIFGIAVILFVINVILAFAGDPGRCDSGDRTINISDANADTFQSKWDAFDDTLDGGSPAAVAFNESEISSRADRYLTDEHDTPINNVVVCIHDGSGEASGSLETPIGLNADVRVKGTMELTGDHPKAIITDIDIGGIPDFFLGPMEGWLEDLIEDQLDDIDLDHDYTPTLTEGNAEINGIP